MKKRLLSLLLILTLSLSFAACGELIPAAPGGNDTPPSPAPPGGEGGGDTPGGETEEEPFVITVTYGGSIFMPGVATNPDKAMKVRLTDGKNYYTETVGADGRATFYGLDGDYTATLLNTPEGFTYDPNIYRVNNNKKSLSIELLALTPTTGYGVSSYKPIKTKKTGVYRATIEEAGQVVFYEFTPKQAGSYRIESMMDVSSGMFNPMVDVYVGGSVGFNMFIERIDGGGAGEGYTKNFKHTLNVDEEFLGNGYIFGIMVEGKDAVYPTTVDFSITYMGDYSIDWVESSLVKPSFIPNYKTANGKPDEDAYQAWRTAYFEGLDADLSRFGNTTYYDAATRISGKRIFDQRYYKLNPADGYYHVYDEVKYAATGGYGPILYADITSACMFLAESFAVVEYQGNKALTLNEGRENYKLFIEGYDVLSVTQPSQEGSYFCNSDCPCYLAYTQNKPGNNGGVCTLEDNCQKCNAGCRHIPEALKYQKGYADICNADGRAPVTEELKDFLQKYSESQRLFSDGNGWAESFSPRYDAYEDSQWLFACGYYAN